MNLFGLYNPTTNLWRSRKWQERWGDLSEAVTFTSRKNAEARLRAHRRKWNSYVKTWVHSEHKNAALQTQSLWDSVVVKELTLVG